METSQHQEWRARQRLNWRAIFQTGLCVGGVLFIMSGGTPWSTAGTMNVIMGRDLPVGFFTLLFLHFALSFFYAGVIGAVVYRLRLGAAVAAGLATGIGLYVLNYVFFSALAVQMQSPEIRAVLVHVVFSVFATLVYKAASVPRPFRGDREQILSRERAEGWLDANANDPEPEPAIHSHAMAGRSW